MLLISGAMRDTQDLIEVLPEFFRFETAQDHYHIPPQSMTGCFEGE
jgi:hypothetical protein